MEHAVAEIFQQTIDVAPLIALSGFAVYLLLLADTRRAAVKSSNGRLHAASPDSPL